MFRKNDIVIRKVKTIDNRLPVDSRYTVKRIVDDCYMELEEIVGQYQMVNFVLLTPEEANKDRGESTGIEKLVDALRTIDTWNRSHPTALMVDVEAYPAQDGGSQFCVNGEGFNDLNGFHEYISHYAVKKDKRRALEYAMNMIKSELNEE